MNNLRLLALPLVAAATLVACGDDGGSSRAATATPGDAFCVAGEKMSANLDALGAAFDANDPAAVEAAMGVVLTEGASITKLAPADISAQMTLIVGTWDSVAAVLENNGWDIAAAAADPDFVTEEEGAALEATGDEIEAYLTDKCDIGS